MTSTRALASLVADSSATASLTLFDRALDEAGRALPGTLTVIAIKVALPAYSPVICAWPLLGYALTWAASGSPRTALLQRDDPLAKET